MLPSASTTPVRTVDRVDGLDAILDDDIDGVLLSRRLPAFVVSALNDPPGGETPDGRFCIAARGARESVLSLFDGWR